MAHGPPLSARPHEQGSYKSVAPPARYAWPDQTEMKLRRRLRPCFECGGPAPLSSGETWLAGEPAEALHFCRFRVYPVTCHSKRKCPEAGKWKRSSRPRAAGCPKRRHVAALESGPFDASPLGNATGRSGLRVSDSFIKATKLTTRFTMKFAPGFVPQAAIRLSLS